MNKKNILIGPIKKCTEFTSEDFFRINLFIGKVRICSLKTKFNQFNGEKYYEEALLLKTSFGYLNISNINNDLELLKKILLGKIKLIPKVPRRTSQLFVDEKELKLYDKEKVKTKKI